MAFLGSLDGGMEKAVAMSRLQEERSRRDFLIGGLQYLYSEFGIFAGSWGMGGGRICGGK